ncbi:glycoside hydrolase superfamily [Blakeslea trispora]|nr:glycoside hydrolase superfamily [Blakeslea trispora]
MTKQSLEQNIGQLFMCGFDGFEPTQGILDLIRNHGLGSIILFSRNIESPEQTQRLTRALQQAAKEAGHARPLFIAVDQENGVVRRLGKSNTYFPGSMALGALNSSSNAYQVATATAKELLALGINWNLAPVLDVNSNPLNPVIGTRSFGEDPQLVARLGLAQIEGYQKHAVITSVKHFPGHGDTAVDSHLGLPVIHKTLNELEATELVPFKHVLGAHTNTPASVMMAHVALPNLIQEDNRPASISSEIVTDLLRHRLGYKGIIITDCCEMNAIKDTVGTAKGALLALCAGNDISMICHTLEYQSAAIDLLRKKLKQGTISQEALSNSLERISNLKDTYLSWEKALGENDMSIISCKQHVGMSQRIYNKVPTVVRDDLHLLPIRPSKEEKILFLGAHVPLTLAIDSEPEPFNSMYVSVQQRHGNTEYIIFNQHENDALVKKIQEADYVMIGTANANLHPFQSKLVQTAHKHAKRLIVVAIINPYDLMVFPQVSTFVTTYEYTPPANEAFVRLVFGEIDTFSKLPVTIPVLAAPVREPFERVVTFDCSAENLQQAHALWDTIFGENWPLLFENFKTVLSRLQQGHHLAVYNDEGKLVGFAATQTLAAENAGQLALLMVHPDHRNKGIGSRLNDACLDMFRLNGSSVMLGSTYPRFFCGVPNDDLGEKAQVFFERRGYSFSQTVWDMMGDLNEYEIPKEVQQRMTQEDIWFGQIRKDQLQELFEFQSRYFDFWLSTYQHHAALGDDQDFLIAREHDEHGRLIGSLILFTTGKSSPLRTDLIWTHESLFGSQSGGMACVGIASEDRGRGIGLGLVCYANSALRNRGVQKSYVDWVELTDFYSRTDYYKWRSYRLGAIK